MIHYCYINVQKTIIDLHDLGGQSRVRGPNSARGVPLHHIFFDFLFNTNWIPKPLFFKNSLQIYKKWQRIK
jgi:hypothetical protein